YLEIPNLRRKAFEHIGATVRHILFRQPSKYVSRREARIYWLYGLLAGTYSTWLLGFILLYFGRFLTARYQGWGAAFFVGLVLVMFRAPIRKAGRWLTSLFKATRGTLALMKRTVRLAIVPVVAAAALYFIKTDFKVSGEFRILPVHNAEVRAEV